jgi:hypothetical protein
MKKSVRTPAHKKTLVPRDARNPKLMTMARSVAEIVLDPEALLDEIYESPCDAARRALEKAIRDDWKAKGISLKNEDDEACLSEQAMFLVGIAIGQRLGGAR